MVSGQYHNHWTPSFNEESLLLLGAVVGGEAGPSAIYYNPTSISEITEPKFSLHASFISYMVKPKNHQEWSLEFAFLNNEKYRLDLTQSVNQNTDVLTNLPGEEHYYSFFQYQINQK